MKEKIIEPRINHEIKGHTEVRLIYKEKRNESSENDFNKVVSWGKAVSLSKEKQLDLIEINPNTTPIIVRLDDYSKFLYELKKQAKQKNKKTSTLKEIQLKGNISSNDLSIKVRKALEFIEKGDKVKVVLTLKGRELSRREDFKKPFYQFINEMIDSGKVSFETTPQDDERRTLVILKKK